MINSNFIKYLLILTLFTSCFKNNSFEEFSSSKEYYFKYSFDGDSTIFYLAPNSLKEDSYLYFVENSSYSVSLRLDSTIDNVILNTNIYNFYSSDELLKPGKMSFFSDDVYFNWGPPVLHRYQVIASDYENDNILNYLADTSNWEILLDTVVSNDVWHHLEITTDKIDKAYFVIQKL